MFNAINKKFLIVCVIFILISAGFVLLCRDGNAVIREELHTRENRQSQCFNQPTSGNSNIDSWLSFIGILTTLFAVFFVYTGFKIDNTKEKIDGAEKRILDLEKKIQEEIYEYARQLEYCMSYIVQKNFDKAIDALTVLRSEPIVLKDGRKINTCCFFLAHCYYEKGLVEKDIIKKKENLALAVEYINQAIIEPTHPFRNEIINAFNELDKKQNI
jgi:hypothetical protein